VLLCSGTIEELEAIQPDIAVIHCWKPYYYPTKEETYNVMENLKPYV
jgi:hypothetical protein